MRLCPQRHEQSPSQSENLRRLWATVILPLEQRWWSDDQDCSTRKWVFVDEDTKSPKTQVRDCRNFCFEWVSRWASLVVVAVIQLIVRCCQQHVMKVLTNHLLNCVDESRYGSNDSNQSVSLFSEFLTLECRARWEDMENKYFWKSRALKEPIFLRN